MLTLLLAAIHIKYRSLEHARSECAMTVSDDHEMDSIYINSEVPFPELTEFITQSAKQYDLNLLTIQDTLKAGFEHFLKNINPKIKRIVVGIRYSDPYGSELQYEQQTDHNWPKFIRIHPILHWHYCDVWHFLLCCKISYCSLYNHGYTSLGGVDTTSPNPYLKSGSSYLPAYALQDHADDRERLGRKK
ncbi:hypothetical protein PUMCH_001121 [Australozyma saopauloensis]|uniref:FAD synthase n=1 Tax=Australozyma saopauloensis TaxID=291208 RepID=A0AAX4H6L7_9ASCO|nr:hypothetical protein PUMCH_001121 [[Candida] saopauloensis]